MSSTRYLLRRLAPHVLVFCFALCGAQAQEFLDTLGRWKDLDLSGVSTSGAMPRSIIAHQGMILVGREGGSILRGIDTGEIWSEVGAGSGAPADLQAVWSFDFLDTATDANRIYGVARFGTGGTRHTAMIHSSDAGRTWSESTPLPFLDAYYTRPVDTVLINGHPRIDFVADTVTGARVLFLYCGVGLWRSLDTGRTFSKESSVVAAYQLWMANSRVGAGFIKPVGQIYLGDLAMTFDGGATWRSIFRIVDDQNRFPMGYAIDGRHLRVVIPDRHKNFERWTYWATDDGGLSWGRRDDFPAPRRPLWGTAFWLDTADIHVVCDGAAIQHSPDGARGFHLLHDTVPNMILSELLVLVLPKAPIAARDNRYIYIVGPDDRAFRWRFANPGPRLQASVPTGERGNLIEHRGDRLRAPGSIALRVIDLLGRDVISTDQEELSLNVLRSGTYLAVVRLRDGSVNSMPIVVVNR